MANKQISSRLRTFGGKKSPDEFIEDADCFRNLSLDLRKQIIRNVVLWYPKADIEKEWHAWMAKRPKAQKEKLIRALRIVLFFIQEIIKNRLSDEEATDDLLAVKFDGISIRYFLNQLQKNRSALEQKIAASPGLVIPRLDDVNWRIDIQKSSTYARDIDEPCILLRLSFSGTKKNDISFELSPEQIDSLARNLSIIQKHLAQIVPSLPE
jgi:hypothetical protein